LCGTLQPTGKLLRIHAVGPAPSTLARLIQSGRGHHGLQAGRRCPGPLASGPGQRLTAPALQRPHSDSHLTRHLFQGSTLRRQRVGKRQVTLSGETGLTKGMLSSYETGRQLPSLSSLLTMLVGLGCDFHDLQDAMDHLAGKPPRLKAAEEEQPKADAEREVGG